MQHSASLPPSRATIAALSALALLHDDVRRRARSTTWTPPFVRRCKSAPASSAFRGHPPRRTPCVARSRKHRRSPSSGRWALRKGQRRQDRRCCIDKQSPLGRARPQAGAAARGANAEEVQEPAANSRRHPDGQHGQAPAGVTGDRLGLQAAGGGNPMPSSTSRSNPIHALVDAPVPPSVKPPAQRPPPKPGAPRRDRIRQSAASARQNAAVFFRTRQPTGALAPQSCTRYSGSRGSARPRPVGVSISPATARHGRSHRARHQDARPVDCRSGHRNRQDFRVPRAARLSIRRRGDHLHRQPRHRRTSSSNAICAAHPRDALKVPVSVALLAGPRQGNYVCHHHLERASAQGTFAASRADVAHLPRIASFVRGRRRPETRAASWPTFPRTPQSGPTPSSTRE